MTLAVLIATLLAPSRPPIGSIRMRNGHSILAHGARSLLVTGLIAVTALVSIAVAPPADLPWHWLLLAYASSVLVAAARARFSASGIAPIGTHGDARVVLALSATAWIAWLPASWPAEIAAHPFLVLNFAVALAGASDGAWLALARHRLQVSDAQVLAMFTRALRAGEACSWRIAVPGPRRDGP